VTSSRSVVDPGKVINPRQLDRCMKSGVVMGLSEALKEEVTFDKEKVTSTNWSRYKILTMEETPEIKVVQIHATTRDLAAAPKRQMQLFPPAVAAALFDATGVCPRRIPLNPAYVRPAQGLISTAITNYCEHSSAKFSVHLASVVVGCLRLAEFRLGNLGRLLRPALVHSGEAPLSTLPRCANRFFVNQNKDGIAVAKNQNAHRHPTAALHRNIKSTSWTLPSATIFLRPTGRPFTTSSTGTSRVAPMRARSICQ